MSLEVWAGLCGASVGGAAAATAAVVVVPPIVQQPRKRHSLKQA
jgi:hypothetical protein